MQRWVFSHLVQVGCAGTPPRCTPRNPPCCIPSLAARTRCPSLTCRPRRWFRSLHPAVASPIWPQKAPLWSRPWKLLRAPRLYGDTPRKSARRQRIPEAVASTERAGRKPKSAGCRSQEPEELQQEHVHCSILFIFNWLSSSIYARVLHFLSMLLHLLHLTSPFLTLDEVQLCQEFELFGNIQLEVSEGWISSQSEMLEILDCFAQPGSVKEGKKTE